MRFGGRQVTVALATLVVVVPAALGLACSVAAGATTPPPRIPTSAGYWLAGADGGVFSFGAPFFGSGTAAAGSGACSFSPQPPSTASGDLGCTGIASDGDGQGYWLLNGVRSATPFGAATLDPAACTSLDGATGTWVGVAAATDGHGIWLASSNGAVMGCGSVPSPSGGVSGLALAAPIVGIAPTPDHGGYWLVGADGGVFAFGQAPFYGSLGGRALNAPIVGMASTPDGRGYWLVGADGGVFSFGDASFSGSMGGRQLDAPVVGMAANPDGPGYWLAAADGGVFSFGGAPFEGSMAGHPLDGPIVGMAAASRAG